MIESAAPGETIVAVHDITRDFQAGGVVVHALRGVSLRIGAGELVALRGRSGAGKTTLLNIITGLDNSTHGQVHVLGHDLAHMSERARAKLRRASIGMIFQDAHLLALLTAQENVELPLRLAGADPRRRGEGSRAALALVGLEARAQHRGLELSGGEQQRVALARALAHEPRFIVADEPTGNLDTMTGHAIIELLRDVAHRRGIGLLVATHDMAVVSVADRVLAIADGVLTSL